MTKLLHIKTPEYEYFFDKEEFEERNIYFELYCDGGDPNEVIVENDIITIKEGSNNLGSVKVEKQTKYGDDKYITVINDPNWSLFIHIYDKVMEESGLFNMNDHSTTRVVIKLRTMNDDGSVNSVRDWDKNAWYLRQKMSSELKKVTVPKAL